MSQMIEAVYEKGVFRPLSPVELPEGARVQLAAIAAPTPDDHTRQQLIAEGVSPEEADRILENFRLLWSSYDTLTEAQKEALEQSRLDQEHFFDRPK